MKITIVMGFFLPVPPVAGGATEKIWHRLAREFAAAGHEVALVARTWPGMAGVESADGVRFVRVPGFDHSRHLWRNLLLDAWWGWRVRRRLPPADLVVCNTVSLPVWLRTVKPAAGRVTVVLGRMPKGQTRWYGRVDRLLATSEAVAARVREASPRLAGRLRVFPNPVDWHLHAGARLAAPPSEAVTIGYVGRLHPEKGLELLVDAAVRLAETPGLPLWRLQLAGPASVPQGGGGEAYRDGLASRHGARLGSRLSIRPPEFDPARLAAIYAALDVFCYPSLAEQGESFGIAPLEAMAAGAVPVVSRLDCFRDYIRPGENGVVFDHRAAHAAAALAAALADLVADAPRRRQLAARAQETARAYDYTACARTLLADFAQLTTRAPAA